jgi:ribosomal protein S18 acetylase RimI-like enzyme
MPETTASIAPHIRFAELSDDAALSALDRVTWSTLHSVKPRERRPYGPFFNERFGPRDHLVAVLDGSLAGFIRFGFPTPLAANAHVRQVQGLAVATEARGRGVGRALLGALLEEARRQGALRVTLRVLGHNLPARRLYESMGFVVEGIQPGEFYVAGKYVDDVLMGRRV